MKTEIPAKTLETIIAACSECGARLIEATARGTAPKRLKLDVVIDSEQGITHEVCSKVSKLLDAAAENDPFLAELFALDVLSPGADRPFAEPWQFPKHIGRSLEISLKSGGSIAGVLRETKETGVVIQPKKTTKDKAEQKEQEIPYREIVSAVVKIKV